MNSIITEVKELLPQKFPFAMVDALAYYDEEKVVTHFTIKEDNLFLEDGRMNESGLIENFAQSIALHTSYGFYIRDEIAPVGYIGNVTNLSITDFPKLGEVLETRVKIIQEFMGITLVEGEILLNNQVIFTSKMKTFIAAETPAN
ncbi:MAG: hypothetical protein H3C31_08350 [Brumimicrobium sp.]|nr:hypothetical protein [Brumimicrobium sp.]